MRLLAMMFLTVMLVGCAGSQLRFGPAGSGIALPDEGPGIEFAFSDGDGQVTTGGRIVADLPGWLDPIWEAVVSILPSINYNFKGDGAKTPTGPEPEPDQ